MSAELPSPGIDVFDSRTASEEGWTVVPRPRRRLIGRLALLLAMLAWVADGLAVGVSVERNDQLSTVFVIAAICASALAFGGGIFAVVTRRGRLSGAVGAVVGILANPFVLIATLEFFSGFASN